MGIRRVFVGLLAAFLLVMSACADDDSVSPGSSTTDAVSSTTLPVTSTSSSTTVVAGDEGEFGGAPDPEGAPEGEDPTEIFPEHLTLSMLGSTWEFPSAACVYDPERPEWSVFAFNADTVVHLSDTAGGGEIVWLANIVPFDPEEVVIPIDLEDVVAPVQLDQLVKTELQWMNAPQDSSGYFDDFAVSDLVITGEVTLTKIPLDGTTETGSVEAHCDRWYEARPEAGWFPQVVGFSPPPDPDETFPVPMFDLWHTRLLTAQFAEDPTGLSDVTVLVTAGPKMSGGVHGIELTWPGIIELGIRGVTATGQWDPSKEPFWSTTIELPSDLSAADAAVLGTGLRSETVDSLYLTPFQAFATFSLPWLLKLTDPTGGVEIRWAVVPVIC